jgi:Ca-activated chloride channel homolog
MAPCRKVTSIFKTPRRDSRGNAATDPWCRTIALTLFLLVLAAPVFSQAENDIIKIDSSLVVINVSVTDAAGRWITGLKQNQFNLFVDGRPQKIDFFEAEKTPFAAVILLDTSGSMEARVTLARAAAMNFLDGLRTDDCAAIYNFDSKVSLIQDFSNSRDIVDRAFDLKADGMTVLNDAIFDAARRLSARPEKRRAIIVLSDGADTNSRASGGKALREALAAGANVYTVDMAPADVPGPDRAASQAALKNFAEKTGGYFIATPGGAALRSAFKNIVEELGTQYTLGYEPKTDDKAGIWHALDVKTSVANARVRARKGYAAASP